MWHIVEIVHNLFKRFDKGALITRHKIVRLNKLIGVENPSDVYTWALNLKANGGVSKDHHDSISDIEFTFNNYHNKSSEWRVTRNISTLI